MQESFQDFQTIAEGFKFNYKLESDGLGGYKFKHNTQFKNGQILLDGVDVNEEIKREIQEFFPNTEPQKHLRLRNTDYDGLYTPINRKSNVFAFPTGINLLWNSTNNIFVKEDGDDLLVVAFVHVVQSSGTFFGSVELNPPGSWCVLRFTQNPADITTPNISSLVSFETKLAQSTVQAYGLRYPRHSSIAVVY